MRVVAVWVAAQAPPFLRVVSRLSNPFHFTISRCFWMKLWLSCNRQKAVDSWM